MEIWAIVAGTGGRILVSNEGRVKSLLRDERILKTYPDQKGYMRVKITLDRVPHSYKVHRIVAEAFIDNPEGKPQVNHKDGNKRNNRADNLEWVTNRENAMHAIKTGLWGSVLKGAYQENESRKKAVTAIRGDSRLEFESVSSAERYFNSRHISDALKGKRNHVKGWSFAYAEGR